MRILFRYLSLFFLIMVFVGVLPACNSVNPSTPVLPTTIVVSPIPSQTATETAVPPSPTPIPLAATVNGEAISLAEFDAELGRYQSAQVSTPIQDDPKARDTVLNDLIDQTLLAQAARQDGYIVDDQTLQEHKDRLIDQIGGEEALQAWLDRQGYHPEDFEIALRRSIEASWMRDKILAQVPEVAEQVHARQILVFDQEEARQIQRELQSGKDFATLVAIYDPQTLGDLGWFPRGYLVDPKLDEAAFNLQPDEYSDIIETRVGFHILQVLERDQARLLDPDARLVLQEKALQDWIEAQRNQSEIVILNLDG